MKAKNTISSTLCFFFVITLTDIKDILLVKSAFPASSRRDLTFGFVMVAYQHFHSSSPVWQ